VGDAHNPNTNHEITKERKHEKEVEGDDRPRLFSFRVFAFRHFVILFSIHNILSRREDFVAVSMK
jgi:hypothetical protein